MTVGNQLGVVYVDLPYDVLEGCLGIDGLDCEVDSVVLSNLPVADHVK